MIEATKWTDASETLPERLKDSDVSEDVLGLHISETGKRYYFIICYCYYFNNWLHDRGFDSEYHPIQYWQKLPI